MNKKLTLNITAARREELMKNHLSRINSDDNISAKNDTVVEPVSKNPVNQTKKVKKPKFSSYFNYNLFVEWLAMFRTEYPLAFPPKKRLPLAVGIGIEIRKILGEKGITKGQVNRFMGWYVHSKQYLKEIVAGAARVNLQGEVVGEVTEQEVSYAQEALARKKALLTKLSCCK